MLETEFLTPEQIARRLQVRPRTVQEWLRTGRLAGLKLGKLWRIRAVDLDEFLRDRGREGHPPAMGSGQASPESGAGRNSQSLPAVEAHDGEAILEMFDRIWSQVPDEEMARLPVDLAEQHDHYIYGLPKRSR